MDNGFHFRWDIFFSAIFQPDRQILMGLSLTVGISVMAMLLGIVLGSLLALAQISANGILRRAAWLYVWVFRGTPLLVQLMIIFFGFGVLKIYTWPDIALGGLVVPGNVQAGIIAFGLNEAAYMAEIIRAGIMSVAKGQSEAAKALGMTYPLAMRRIVMPQALRVIVPVMGNNFNGMLKATSLLVVISVPELFVVFTYKNGSGPWVFRPFELFLAAGVWYLLLTTIWSLIQSRIEAHLGRGYSDGLRKKATPDLAAEVIAGMDAR